MEALSTLYNLWYYEWNQDSGAIFSSLFLSNWMGSRQYIVTNLEDLMLRSNVSFNDKLIGEVNLWNYNVDMSRANNSYLLNLIKCRPLYFLVFSSFVFCFCQIISVFLITTLLDTTFIFSIWLRASRLSLSFYFHVTQYNL